MITKTELEVSLLESKLPPSNRKEARHVAREVGSFPRIHNIQ